MKPYLLISLALFLSCNLIAQRALRKQVANDNGPRIVFNANGQMVAAPPDLITNRTRLRIIVQLGQDYDEKTLVSIFNQYLQTITRMEALDSTSGKKKILVALGLDGKSDAATVISITEKELAAQMHLLLTVPRYRDMIKKHFTLASVEPGLEKLRAYKVIDPALQKLEQMIVVPAYSDLLYPAFTFTIHMTNINGLPVRTPCDTTFVLTRDNCDCGAEFSTEMKFDSLTMGPVKYTYELRRTENLFNIVVAQTKPMADYLRSISGINIKPLAARINDLFNFTPVVKDSTFGINQKDVDDLKKYFALKEIGKLDQQTQQAETNAWPPYKIMPLQKDLQEIKILLKPFVSDSAMSLLMRYALLTQGTAVLANPVASANLTDVQKKLTDMNTQLIIAQKDSADQGGQLSLLKTIPPASASGAGVCCDSSLLGLFQTVQKALRITSDKIDTLKKQIKTAKGKSAGADIANLLNKPSVLKDSLLYSGFVYVNYQPGNSLKNNGRWVRPNLSGYAYMRHHNALGAYELMEKDPVLGINETQRLFPLIENANAKQNFIAPLTLTPIAATDDLDGISSELLGKGLSKDVFPLNAAAKDSVTKKINAPDKYNLNILAGTYEDVKPEATKADVILKPYANGTLMLPVQLTKSTAANYMTKPAWDERILSPAPQNATYPIADSVSGKNLAPGSLVYPYRYNKLVHFRIKAGFAYSTFEGRTYTINAASNTATYTNNWTGLAPDVGLQIFTAPLDLQSKKIFPHGLPPFLYVGYLFSGASTDNLLVGGGWEIFSGVAVIGGVHFGKDQRLALTEGALQEQDYYKTAAFISVSIGLEAFNDLFNTAKPTLK